MGTKDSHIYLKGVYDDVVVVDGHRINEGELMEKVCGILGMADVVTNRGTSLLLLFHMPPSNYHCQFYRDNTKRLHRVLPLQCLDVVVYNLNLNSYYVPP